MFEKRTRMSALIVLAVLIATCGSAPSPAPFPPTGAATLATSMAAISVHTAVRALSIAMSVPTVHDHCILNAFLAAPAMPSRTSRALMPRRLTLPSVQTVASQATARG